MSEVIELRIDSIAAGGDGVGRHDGIVVFVPRSAPGDRARVAVTRHDRLLRGRLLELLEPSPERVDPTCAHYVQDRCGGCQIQHIRYDGQLDAKAGIIRDALTRIGRVATPKPDVEASDGQWRYRRKLTLAMRPRGQGWIAGLHRFDTADVFELRDCPITEESVLEAWAHVLAQTELFPRARELRGAVRLLPEGYSFTLEGGHAWPQHVEFFARQPALLELWWTPADKSRRLLASRPAAEPVAGAAFTQVNRQVAQRLREWVLHLASVVSPASAIDAYAGTGELSLELARQGMRVAAIEIDRDAARAAAARMPAGSRVVAAPVEDALPQELPADLVVLNPPRAGVHARVTSCLEAQAPKPRSLIYVSCNPATLARDVQRLPGYRVTSVKGFDMFPQTAHVETVCELVPRHA